MRFLQSKREMIKHDGIIIALNEDGTALVRIVQTSACAACKARAMCASAESAEKEMTVVLLGENGKVKTESNSTQSYHVGDTVEVMVQQKMGWKAVVLAYLLPFFVMLAVMFIGNGLLAMGDGPMPAGWISAAIFPADSTITRQMRSKRAPIREDVTDTAAHPPKASPKPHPCATISA